MGTTLDILKLLGIGAVGLAVAWVYSRNAAPFWKVWDLTPCQKTILTAMQYVHLRYATRTCRWVVVDPLESDMTVRPFSFDPLPTTLVIPGGPDMGIDDLEKRGYLERDSCSSARRYMTTVKFQRLVESRIVKRLLKQYQFDSQFRDCFTCARGRRANDVPKLFDGLVRREYKMSGMWPGEVLNLNR